MAGPWQVLINYSVAAVLHATAAIRICLILRNMIRFKTRSSQFLVALLINWLVLCILILPLELFGVFTWSVNDDGIRSGYAMFFLGSPPHIFGLALIPVSVFFLTLERIFILLMKLHFRRKHRRMLFIAYFCTIAVGVCTVAFGFYKAFLLLKPLMPCVVNGCILGQYVLVYLGWRAVCAIFNFSFGVCFFVLLYMARKTMKEQQLDQQSEQVTHANRANHYLSMLAIANEFFLGFIPHFFPFIWEEINGPGSSMWTGPLSEIASSIEVTIFTVIYSRLFSPSRFQHRTVKVTTTRTLPATTDQQGTSTNAIRSTNVVRITPEIRRGRAHRSPSPFQLHRQDGKAASSTTTNIFAISTSAALMNPCAPAGTSSQSTNNFLAGTEPAEIPAVKIAESQLAQMGAMLSMSPRKYQQE